MFVNRSIRLSDPFVNLILRLPEKPPNIHTTKQGTAEQHRVASKRCKMTEVEAPAAATEVPNAPSEESTLEDFLYVFTPVVPL